MPLGGRAGENVHGKFLAIPSGKKCGATQGIYTGYIPDWRAQ